MKLVVGLGNPGSEYEHTRLNVGFRVVDKLASKVDWKWSERRNRAVLASGSIGLEKVVLPVKNCRTIGKSDMMWNDKTPDITIDPETYEVKLDGKIATVDPAKELALAQRYFMA